LDQIGQKLVGLDQTKGPSIGPKLTINPNDPNYPKPVFLSRQNVGNSKIEIFNGPTMDQIDPKWIKNFPKKSPKPFLRPNT
jgi:hypothetical protein